HSVRPARRINSRGQQMTDLVIEAVQRIKMRDPDTDQTTVHRGGCTLLIDMQQERIRYTIRKRVDNASRLQAEQNFIRMVGEDSQAYFDSSGQREPFAMLHRGV